MLFVIFLCATLTLYAQSQQSQETRDAIQDQRLAQTEIVSANNARNVAELYTQFWAMKSSLDRFTGIGIGFGAALTALQAIQLLLQVKNGKRA